MSRLEDSANAFTSWLSEWAGRKQVSGVASNGNNGAGECRELPLGANAAGLVPSGKSVEAPSLRNEHSASPVNSSPYLPYAGVQGRSVCFPAVPPYRPPMFPEDAEESDDGAVMREMIDNIGGFRP